MSDTFIHGRKICDDLPQVCEDLFKNGTQGRDDRKTNFIEMRFLSSGLIYLNFECNVINALHF